MLLYICTFLFVNQILAEVVVENLKQWSRELRREGVVLAHFRTKWCSPCDRLEQEWDRKGLKNTLKKVFEILLNPIEEFNKALVFKNSKIRSSRPSLLIVQKMKKSVRNTMSRAFHASFPFVTGTRY